MASVKDKGFSEYRLNTKYRFWGDDEGGLAVIASVNLNRLEDDPFTGKDPGPTYNIELAADTMLEKLALALNVGYRFRDPGDPIAAINEIKPIKNQYIASVAANYPFTESWSVIGEVFGSRPSQKYQGNTYLQQSSLEWTGSLKYKPMMNLALYLGGGTKLIDGSATPDWRVFTGMNWTFGPLWGNPKTAPQEEKTMKVEDPEEQTVLAEQDEEGGEVTVDPTEFDQPIKEKQTFRLHSILFEFNSDKLKKSSYPFLDKFAAYLKKPPTLKKLVIQGYTDSVGADAYNIKLSKRRAVSVANYLTKKQHIPAKKIQTQGLGKAHPIADNSTQEGRDKNRRVEFKVSREKK
jgi:outer membrane protein OmpA-like peptidoglycan-associated protein